MLRLLNDIRVRTKIVIAFVLILCCATGLGLFAIQRLATVNAASAAIREEWLPQTRILGELAYHVMRYRQLEATAALAPPGAKQAEAREIQAERALVDKAIATYTPFVSTDEERRFADEVTRLWAAYVGQSKEFLVLALYGDADAATEQYRGPMRDTFKQLQAGVDKGIGFNVGQASAAAQRGAALGEAARSWIVIGLATVAALCALIGWMVVKGISGPIVIMTGAMSKLAKGDNEAEVPGLGRKDEIGAMASAVQVFKEAAVTKLRLEAEAEAARRAGEVARDRNEAERAAAAEAQSQVVTAIGSGLEALSRGDLTARLERPFMADYEGLRANFNAAMAQLHELVSGIVSNTGGIRSGTSEIAQAADDLSRRTEQQAASLEETAAALEEITTTVRRTAEGAKHAGEAVGQARADADKSGGIVREAVSAMSEIEQSAQQISQIIGVIDEIAFQTNLLALNAGVEAARAGEAGRGFAVVASEVRALAQRSAEAAKEIKALISTSTQQVGRGVDLVGETGRALGRIVTQVAEISTVVGEIAASAQEQATGLAEVNTAVNQMDQVTQQNAAMVEQSTAASHALAQETEQLAKLTERFRLGQDPGSPAQEPRSWRRAG
jgi:methyl-accepting chemotaxis protein